MPDQQLHLLVNHIPILGLGFGGLLLGLSLIPKLRSMAPAALVLLMLSGLATIPAFTTGHPAEEAIEEMPQVSEQIIEVHEHTAKTFRIFGLLIGIGSLGALALTQKHKNHPALLGGLFALTLVSGYYGALTGHTGGQIRRPDLRDGAAATSSEKEEGEEGESEEKGESGERGEAKTPTPNPAPDRDND